LDLDDEVENGADIVGDMDFSERVSGNDALLLGDAVADFVGGLRLKEIDGFSIVGEWDCVRDVEGIADNDGEMDSESESDGDLLRDAPGVTESVQESDDVTVRDWLRPCIDEDAEGLSTLWLMVRVALRVNELVASRVGVNDATCVRLT
jgi:hypothetical protein